MPGLFSLARAHCVITGGTRGIGKAIADRFLAEGAFVTVVARSKPEDLLNDDMHIVGGRAGKLSFVKGDASVRETWDRIGLEVPDPDVLVNCAGITQKSLLVRTSDEEARAIIDTNLHSAILGCRYAARSMMKRRRGGCIINVSSLLATKGTEGTSVYAASKAGLLGLTSSLAVEYGKSNVRVNALVPGYIQTSMTEEISKARLSQIPLGRVGDADAVADAAAFLAKNPYASNCILNIDGGLSAV
ncbi:gluconate 5-dehydrogenase [Coniochaeta sp. 2T2.1]|nr:gluconate 5-dehydrogenase [Coniochaeta sp. 2T2.1]